MGALRRPHGRKSARRDPHVSEEPRSPAECICQELPLFPPGSLAAPVCDGSRLPAATEPVLRRKRCGPVNPARGADTALAPFW